MTYGHIAILFYSISSFFYGMFFIVYMYRCAKEHEKHMAAIQEDASVARGLYNAAVEEIIRNVLEERSNRELEKHVLYWMPED